MRDQPFRIVKYLQATTAVWDSAAEDWDFTGPAGQPSGQKVAANLFVNTEELDVSGWSHQELTAFFANQSIQRSKAYVASGDVVTSLPTGNGGIAASDVLIVSDVPLTVDATIQEAGFMSHDSDYTTILFGQGVLLTQNLNAPLQMTVTDSWSFGSGEPSASERLWLYRLFYITKPTLTVGDGIQFPEIRYVAQGIAAEEDDYVYLNRLRRSYELQQL